MRHLTIISGGQTGVDRAALDVAIECHLPHGGWCPKGRLAEDDFIDMKYKLQETPSSKYEQRTKWNVRDSDGTLILYLNEMKSGTAYTRECCKQLSKPCLCLDLLNLPKNYGDNFVEWIATQNIQILNVAGPRESCRPEGIYNIAKNVIVLLIKSFWYAVD